MELKNLSQERLNELILKEEIFNRFGLIEQHNLSIQNLQKEIQDFNNQLNKISNT